MYKAEYQKLVKILVLLDARIDEAEDAVQKAMTYFAQCSMAGKAVDNPPAYVRKAAMRYFLKDRERNRQRMPRELQGGHLFIEKYLDEQLTAWEDETYVQHLLGTLTPAQREVFKLVVEGMSTPDIAEHLRKTHANVRQLRKQSRDRLLEQHPDIAALAPRVTQPSRPRRDGRSTAITPAPRTEEVQ